MLIFRILERALFFFLALFSLYACSSAEEKSISYRIEDLPLDSVPSEIWFPELMANNTSYMTSMNSLLCLVPPNSESLAYFIDEKTGKEIGFFGHVGQGPEDMDQLPQYVGKSKDGDTLILHDFNARNFRAYTVIPKDSTVSFRQAFKKKVVDPKVDGSSSGFQAMCRLDNGCYVCVSYLANDTFYTLLDSELNTVAKYGHFPLKEFGDDAKALKILYSFQGTLASHKNTAFYAATRFGYISRYDLSNPVEPKLLWEHTYSDIDYRVSNNGVKFQEKNVYGFSRIIVNDKYIFGTFSGIPNRKMFKEKSTYAVFPETLVVLNHDGVPLGRFKLKSKSHSLALSSDEKYLYIQHVNPEMEIERILVADIVKKLRKS